MNITKEKAAAARSLIEHPLMIEILSGLESEAIEAAIRAELKDDDSRRVYLDQVRAVRALRSQLSFLVMEGGTMAPRGGGAG